MTTTKKFKIHKSVIRTIIEEQSGGIPKAFAEMVMNSVDAGAKNIRINISSTKFSIVDDGAGFKNKTEVLEYFGKFGSPHEQNDAHYGRFRIGRGQLFAIGSSTWRSGTLEMHVDLSDNLRNKNAVEELGYTIKDNLLEVGGCQITGEFFEPLEAFNSHIYSFDEELAQNLKIFKTKKESQFDDFAEALMEADRYTYNGSFFRDFYRLVALIKNTNIYLNDELISGYLKPELISVDDSGHFEIYKLKNMTTPALMHIYNKGVGVTYHHSHTNIILNFLTQPKISMARNSIAKDCPMYKAGEKAVKQICFNRAVSGDIYFKKYLDNLIEELFNEHSANEFDCHYDWQEHSDYQSIYDFTKSVNVSVLSNDFKTITLFELICLINHSIYKRYDGDAVDGLMNEQKNPKANEFKKKCLKEYNATIKKFKDFEFSIFERYSALNKLVAKGVREFIKSSPKKILVACGVPGFYDIDYIFSLNLSLMAYKYLYFGNKLVDMDYSYEFLSADENNFLKESIGSDPVQLGGKFVYRNATQCTTSNAIAHSHYLDFVKELFKFAHDYIIRNIKIAELPKSHPLSLKSTDDLNFIFMAGDQNFATIRGEPWAFTYIKHHYCNDKHFVLIHLRELKANFKYVQNNSDDERLNILLDFMHLLLNIYNLDDEDLSELHQLRVGYENFCFNQNDIKEQSMVVADMIRNFNQTHHIYKNKSAQKFKTAKRIADQISMWPKNHPLAQLSKDTYLLINKAQEGGVV